MTVLTDTQVITASGGLVELGYSAKTTDTTITSQTAGSGDVVISPVTVVCDGSPVLVEFNASCQVGAGNQINVSLYRDGAEIVRFWIFEYANGAAAGQTTLRRIYRDTPTAGSHTYEVRAFRSNSNGVTTVFASATSTSTGPAIFRVSKIVTATQWPAVTTGTIICTSSTRPASPFAGQEIYETDTSLSYTYSGSAWVQTGNLGAWTTFSPTLTQSGTVTKTDSYCRWTRYGRTIHATTYVTATGSGTTANPATLSLPVTAVAPAPTRIGSCHYYDASTGVRYTGMAELRSGGNAVGLVGDWSAGDAWGAIPNLPVQASDQIGYSVTYEAAS